MSPAFPQLYYFLTFAFGLLFLALVMIPRSEIPKLFWFGLLWGSSLDMIIEHIYYFANITMYQHMEPFNIGALPIWTVLAWTPTVMIFIYFLPRRKEKYIYWIYLIIWDGLCTSVAVVLNRLDILIFINGGPWIWSIAIFIFMISMTKYYQHLEINKE